MRPQAVETSVKGCERDGKASQGATSLARGDDQEGAPQAIRGGCSLALPGAAAILDACSKPGTVTSASTHANGPGVGTYWPAGSPYPLARQDSPVTWKLWREPIKPGLAPEKGATLQIYNWADYIFPKVVKEFCAAYNCKYQITTFNNMDEAPGEDAHGAIAVRHLLSDPGRPWQARHWQADPAAQPQLHSAPGLRRLGNLPEPVLRPALALHGPVHRVHDGDRIPA